MLNFKELKESIIKDEWDESIIDYSSAIESIVKNKLQLDVKNDQGQTILHQAIELCEQPEDIVLIEILLIHGININTKDDNGMSAFDIANKLAKQKIIELFQRYQPISFKNIIKERANQAILDKNVNELQLLKVEFEQIKVLNDKLLNIYTKIINIISNNNSTVRLSRIFKYFNSSKADKFYTILQGEIIDIPLGKNLAEIINKLITSLLYEANRHDLDSDVCKLLKKIIFHLNPNFKEFNKSDYITYITQREEWSGQYFGEYLSDNSDSDEEKEFLSTKAEYQEERKKRALGFQYTAQVGAVKNCVSHLTQNNTFLNPQYSSHNNLAGLTQNSRTYIDRSTLPITHEMNIDLQRINKAALEGNLLEIVSKVQTKFYVALYRGLHYSNKWNKPSRQAHRQRNEVELPQYSMAVYEDANVPILSESHLHKNNLLDMERKKKLNNTAEKLKRILNSMRNTQPTYFNNYLFNNKADAIQHHYSNDYDAFHNAIKQGDFGEDLKNIAHGKNVMVSTGDIPFHALKYAYGIKYYEGQEENLLKPRWDKFGKLERPYSGKVYIALHPVTDFSKYDPMSVLRLNYEGRAKTKDYIIAERETTFHGYLPAGRVFAQHIAKYPSFDKLYKSIYYYKYGMDEELYNYFKALIIKFAPHTPKRLYVENLLGQWLSAYHEVWLIEVARQEAENRNVILVYQDGTGQFSFDPPRYKGFIDEISEPKFGTELFRKRCLREKLSESKKKLEETKIDVLCDDLIKQEKAGTFKPKEITDLLNELSITHASYMQRKLFDAASVGDLNEIDKLLKSGVNIESVDPNGNTPLLFSAAAGKAKIIDYLMKCKVNINALNNYGNNALMRAAGNGHLETVKYLYKKTPININQLNIDKRNALFLAAFHGKFEIVKFFVQEKTYNINFIDKKGFSSLLFVLMNKKLKETDVIPIVNLLIQNGADIHLKNNDGKSAKDLAQENNYINVIDIIDEIINQSSLTYRCQ